jgi:hypothetical protein
MQKYFRPEEGLENQADQVASTACRKYITDMHHKTRVPAHIDYHTSVLGESLFEAQARQTTLTWEQYLDVHE